MSSIYPADMADFLFAMGVAIAFGFAAGVRFQKRRQRRSRALSDFVRGYGNPLEDWRRPGPFQ